MGHYRIEIQAVGGHGCHRDEVKDGQEITAPCGNASCPDCKAGAFVQDLRKTENVESAKLIHWPDTPEQVVDDLVTGVRQGSF